MISSSAAIASYIADVTGELINYVGNFSCENSVQMIKSVDDLHICVCFCLSIYLYPFNINVLSKCRVVWSGAS